MEQLKKLFNPQYPIFTKVWYKSNQKLLLKFANSWIGRKILYIDGNKSSVGKHKITEIGRNYIKWTAGRYYKAEFRTHGKFTKRLYYAFKPVWFIAHYWDILIANNFQPAWSLGFDTLTKYPDADPETNTIDGYVGPSNLNTTWAGLRAATGVDANTASPLYQSGQGSGTTNQFQKLYRVVTLFDTSALTAGAEISSAVYSLYFNNLVNGLGSLAASIVVSNPVSNTDLTGTDYGRFTLTRQATDVAYASFASGDYTNFALNATGLSNISKIAITKFGYVFANDVDNSAPTWASNATSQNGAASSDSGGTTTGPKLVVTYTASSIKTVGGLAKASVKTVKGLAIASVKTINGLA